MSGERGGVPRGRASENMELWQSIRTIYRAALKRLNSRLAREKITFSQYSVLLALSRNGPMQMNRLSEHMLVAPANVTGLVDRMAKKGYVRRKRDSSDRRLFVIEQTETGARVFKSISGRFSQYAKGLALDLTNEELEVTLNALKKVTQRVEAKAEI